MKRMHIHFTGMLFILLLFAACGKNTPNTLPTVDENAPPQPIAFQYNPDESSGYLHTPRGMYGRAITIAAITENSVPFTMVLSANNEPDPAISDNYQRDRRIWDNARRIEHEFNIIIEEVVERGPARLQNQLRTSTMAGSAFADIVVASPELILAAAVGNWIQPLDEIDLPGSDLFGMQTYMRIAAEGLGHVWAFNTNEPHNTAFTLGVNLDIIDAIGAPNPVDLFHAGQWTWDAMLEIMRAATRDTTGDGVIDQWGITGPRCALLRNLIGANDGILITENFTAGLEHPNTIEAIEFLEIMVVDGLWRPEWNIDEAANTMSSFAPGTTVFTTSIPFEIWRNVSPRNASYNFAVVPLPTGPSNTSGNTGMESWGQGLILPHASEWEATDLLMIIEEYFSWAGHDLEMISDVQLVWGGGYYLSEENAIRQANAIAHMGFDYGSHITGFVEELHQLANLFDRRSWYIWEERYNVHEAIEFMHERMQQELDRFFR